jgi:hypothetical protein
MNLNWIVAALYFLQEHQPMSAIWKQQKKNNKITTTTHSSTIPLTTIQATKKVSHMYKLKFIAIT